MIIICVVKGEMVRYRNSAFFLAITVVPLPFLYSYILCIPINLIPKENLGYHVKLNEYVFIFLQIMKKYKNIAIWIWYSLYNTNQRSYKIQTRAKNCNKWLT